MIFCGIHSKSKFLKSRLQKQFLNANKGVLDGKTKILELKLNSQLPTCFLAIENVIFGCQAHNI